MKSDINWMDVKTVEQRNELACQIDKLIEAAYLHSDGLTDKRINELVPGSTARFIISNCSESSDKVSLNSLRNLQAGLLKLEECTIEVSSDVREPVWLSMADWAKKIFGEKTYTRLVLNPQIIGGARVWYRGKLYDASWQKKLAAVIESKREEISAWLGGV